MVDGSDGGVVDGVVVDGVVVDGFCQLPPSVGDLSPPLFVSSPPIPATNKSLISSAFLKLVRASISDRCGTLVRRPVLEEVGKEADSNSRASSSRGADMTEGGREGEKRGRERRGEGGDDGDGCYLEAGTEEKRKSASLLFCVVLFCFLFVEARRRK